MAIVSLPSAEESQLEALAGLPPDLALREAVPLLIRLASNPAFLDAHVLPLLQEAREAEDWYVAHSCEGQNDSYSLQVFVWPPGTRTQIHDHTSWGPTAASWDLCSKSATSASTTACKKAMPV